MGDFHDFVGVLGWDAAMGRALVLCTSMFFALILPAAQESLAPQDWRGSDGLWRRRHFLSAIL